MTVKYKDFKGNKHMQKATNRKTLHKRQVNERGFRS